MSRPTAHVRNVFDLEKELRRAHGGEGHIQFVRPFKLEELQSALAFVDYVEMPPGTSIGLHAHGDDEEVYFIVRGEGRMQLGEEEFAVRAGDLIRNPPGGRHSLRATGSEPTAVLVFDVAQDRDSRSEEA